MDAFYEAAKQLSPPVAAALAALEPGVATAVTEIRLRCQQPVALQTRKGTLYLTKSGHVRMCPASDSFITSFAEIHDSSAASDVYKRQVFMPCAAIPFTACSMR